MRSLLVNDRRFAVAVGQDLEVAGPHRHPCERKVSLPSLMSGSSFTEEVVAFGVQRSARIKAANVGPALLDGPAAFEDERAVALWARR